MVEEKKDAKEMEETEGGGSDEFARLYKESISDIKEGQIVKGRIIAGLGERMPRKSTYFYPKQLSGLVINKF